MIYCVIGIRNISHNLVRQLSPAENWVDPRTFPIEDSEYILVRGVSLAPKYFSKELRGIERRKARSKLALRYFRMDATGGTKAS
jgi:hypothetical protein